MARRRTGASAPPSRSRIHAAALLCGALAAAPAALAQQGEPQTLGEIQVRARQDKAGTENSGSYGTGSMGTATRLDMSIRETPQSVSVVTRQRMDDMGLNSLADVLAHSTGVTVQELDSERINFTARGFAVENFQVDGVSVNAASNALFDTALYDRIEVVRGATGLVSGAGLPSATVNMLHKRPGKEFAASLSSTVGSWNMRRAEADLTAPLNAAGSVRGRAVAVLQRRESYLDLYRERKLAGAAMLEADLGPRTLLSAGLDYQRNTPKGSTWGTTPLFFSDGTPANMPRSFNVAADWSTWERSYRNAYAHLEHGFANDWKVKASFSRLNSNSNTKLYYGGSGYPNRDGSGLAVWAGYFPGSEKQDNLDLYASGPFTLLGRRHELVLGWNGWKREGYAPETATEEIKPADLIVPDFRHWTGKVPEPRAWRTGAASVSTTEQSGVYASTRLQLADTLKLLAGARLSSWKTRGDNYDTAGKYTGTDSRSEAKNVLTPYAGLVFDLDKSSTLYASYTDVFKPQDYRDKDNQFLDPVTGSNVEAGWKGEFFGGALNASLAAFEAKQDNLAEEDQSVPETFLLPDGGKPYVSTGKGTRSKGYEAELSGALASGWQVAAGYTRSSARNGKGAPASTLQPRDMLRLSSSYRLPGAWRALTVGAGLNWQSEIYTTTPGPKGRVRVHQGAYALVDLMARWQFNARLSASLNLNNVFDKSYYRRVGFYSGGYYGEPRYAALNLRYQY